MMIVNFELTILRTPRLQGEGSSVSPLISVALLLLGGQLSHGLGKKRLGIASLLFLGGSSLTLAGSSSLLSLVGALILLGVGNGLFETAMNGATLDWEQVTGRSVINLMHAGYSAGPIVGALGAGTLLQWGWDYSQIFVLLGLLCGVAFVATLPVRYPPLEAKTESTVGLGFTLKLLLSSRAMIALAVICLFGAVGESVANVWSVIYLREQGAEAFLSVATFALLNGAMFLGRLANAPLVDRLGSRTSLIFSGVGLVLANVLLLIPGNLWFSIAAFILLGLAIAGVIPTVLSAAAKLSPRHSGAIAGGMLATVYISFMVCPPLIGWLADLFSLQTALLTLGLSGVGILLLAWKVRRAQG
ncbi:MFS transporter [Candidatus Acetothermia bacterium]|nr:MFS transporter [Candidatus Acetothermia bacterium]